MEGSGLHLRRGILFQEFSVDLVHPAQLFPRSLKGGGDSCRGDGTVDEDLQFFLREFIEIFVQILSNVGEERAHLLVVDDAHRGTPWLPAKISPCRRIETTTFIRERIPMVWAAV